jgi:hypothetical protein
MNPKDPEKEAKRHRIQMDMVMKEGDFKKGERKKIELEIEIRQIKQKKSQLEFELMSKEREMGKMQGDQSMLFAEIKKLKNQLNQL